MTTKDEVRSTVEALRTERALKLALEALEVATTPLAKDRQEVLRAQAAIRSVLNEHGEALAAVPEAHKQPAPVAEPHKQQSAERGEPWRGLTEVEVWNTYKYLWMFHPAEEPRLAGDILKFARAIEAKLKEKNNG